MKTVQKKATAGNTTVKLNAESQAVRRLVGAFKRMPAASQSRILGFIQQDGHATA